MSETLWTAPDGTEYLFVDRNYPSPERVGAALLKLIEQEEDAA
jgi:hypothetical protein